MAKPVLNKGFVIWIIFAIIVALCGIFIGKNTTDVAWYCVIIANIYIVGWRIEQCIEGGE